MDKKLNTVSLSGLMIGPILGSGIVLLPPVAHKMLGDKAIYAWIIIMLLGSVFAYVFTRMSLIADSNEGVSVVIGGNLGGLFRELASDYLTAAVCFGPVAVLFTASDFVSNMIPGGAEYHTAVTFGLLLLSVIVLLMGVTAMGSITLILSSLTALFLVVGSIFSLSRQDVIDFPSGLPNLVSLGSTLLILFWAIIGWEVIGNYVKEVHNPQKTIMRAMKISLSVVVAVYLISTFALQNSLLHLPASNSINMSLVLLPLFGNLANIIMGIVAGGLCYCTLIMILGAVTRQMAARAEAGTMPVFFRQKAGEKSPKRALLALTLFHCIIIVLIHLEFISIEWVVGIANTFFICNALLGLAAGLKCIDGKVIKGMIVVLIVSLGSLLAFSPVTGWVLLIAVTLVSLRVSTVRIRLQ